ncbi:MAG: tetratricopeptide repeat protein [Candidatus Dormibacteraceae bacterium]
MTQEELAERAGISARAVSDIERGLRTTIYRDTAWRLADALKLAAADQTALMAASRREPREQQPELRLPPVPATLLRGREAAVGKLVELLSQANGPRLITVTGPGGAGKTRLALEAAHRLGGRFPMTCFVPLAPVVGLGEVATAIMHALQIPDTGSAAEAIGRRLPAGGLLVLDNFEHLLEAAPLIADLVAAVGGLKFLVTSRAPLRLQLEQEMALDRLGRDPALELFRERVGAIRPELTWGPDEMALAERICARLDHLPLALELAAAGLRHQTLSSLAEGFDGHLAPLGEGWRDAPARHRSMEAAIAWSVDLLAASDRDLLRALSVFAGTFSAARAAVVAGIDERDALVRLSRLVEQSLVELAGELDGRPRYRLLEVVRQSAWTRALEAGELERFRKRHLDQLIALAEAAEPNLHQADRPEWFAQLSAEADNLAAALTYAAESGEAERGLRLATALWRWWRQRGDFNPGRRHLRRLLSQPGAGDAVRARAFWGAIWLALHQQDAPEARALSSELLELAGATGDGLARRNALTGLGMVERYEGRYQESLPLFREALDLARRVADPWILATSIFNVAQPLLEIGARVEALELFSDARRRYLELGDAGFAARMLLYEAQAALAESDGRAAADRILEAAEVFRGLNEAWGQVECLELGSAVLAEFGEVEAAAVAAGAAQAAHRRLGTAQLPPNAVAMAVYLERARNRSEWAWNEAFLAGAEMQLEKAVDDLLLAVRSLA